VLSFIGLLKKRAEKDEAAKTEVALLHRPELSEQNPGQNSDIFRLRVFVAVPTVP
jgi:hypothetical protein